MKELAFLLASILIVSACVSTATGTLIMGIKDAQIRSSKQVVGIGEITAIDLTISSIQVHYSGSGLVREYRNDTEVEANETNETEVISATSGWKTVMNQSKTINLIAYTGNAVALFGNVTLDAGHYQQIRFYIDSANITVNGTQYPLRLPSKVLKLVRQFNVETNKTTVLIMDFNIEKSIKKESGAYMLKPTIKISEFETSKPSRLEIESETGQNFIEAV